MSAQSTVTAILEDHCLDHVRRGHTAEARCVGIGCEWAQIFTSLGEMRKAHAAHLSEVLTSAPGLAVVELPAPVENVTLPTFDAGCGAITHTEPDGDVRLHSVTWTQGRVGGMYRSPRTAIQLALALLAAAYASKGLTVDTSGKFAPGDTAWWHGTKSTVAEVYGTPAGIMVDLAGVGPVYFSALVKEQARTAAEEGLPEHLPAPEHFPVPAHKADPTDPTWHRQDRYGRVLVCPDCANAPWPTATDRAHHGLPEEETP